jgi:hypothetical protein
VVLAEKGGINVAATRRPDPLLNLRNLGSTLLWAERSNARRSSAAATGPPPNSSAKSGRPGGLGDLCICLGARRRPECDLIPAARIA